MRTVHQQLRKSLTTMDRQRTVLIGRWQRAARELGTATGEAAHGFARLASDQRRVWASYLRERTAAARASARAVRARRWVAPAERELLLRLTRVLDQLQATVARRLALLPAAANEPGTSSPLPLPDYGSLTARDIVAQLGELTAEQCRAIREFEQRTKHRATVLRALEQRLAA